MRSRYTIPPWKVAPFMRMVLPLFTGIILQWNMQFNVETLIASGTISLTAFFLLSFLKLAARYKVRQFQGFFLQLVILIAGLLLAWNNDIRNRSDWFGHTDSKYDYVVVSIDEPIIKKERSYKANATVKYVIQHNVNLERSGHVILYFTGAVPPVTYGNRILLKKPLQVIKNSGNPASFNYARYASFQQKFHVVFLGPEDFVLLEQKDDVMFQTLIFNSRRYIVDILQAYVSKDKSIRGIAEALLIGYKQDLDKDLTKAYSETGVVHIIAISGLHLGLIYAMLTWLMNLLPLVNKHKTVKVIIILCSLWLFSLLTGSSASVLRSAVMFTCILIGKTYFKQGSVYNSILASAFMLACYDPCILWDVGFQLSYLAVLGIVWLQKPILHMLYIKSGLLNKIWAMVAVTLSAQLAAFPLCIYYFHQFPNLFLITNVIAVPLSTIILFAELLLMAVSYWDIAAAFTGRIISFLIQVMNDIIIYCSRIPGSVTEDIFATALTTTVLYFLVASGCGWLIYRKKVLLKSMLVFVFTFAALHIYADATSLKQGKIIVYNISKYQAIDFISGQSFFFAGDSAAVKSPLYDFHIRPARIFFQARKFNPYQTYDPLKRFFIFMGKRVCIINKPVNYLPLVTKVPVDVLIISQNPKLAIATLLNALQPAIIVFDSSNSLWKIEGWKKECSALLLPFHSVPHEGAFVSDIN